MFKQQKQQQQFEFLPSNKVIIKKCFIKERKD